MKHILIADDNSPDGTGKLADEIASNDDHVHVMHRLGKEGLGAAYLAALQCGLIDDLQQFSRERFLVYGFDREGSEGPLEFRRPSSEGFLADLAASEERLAKIKAQLASTPKGGGGGNTIITLPNPRKAPEGAVAVAGGSSG